MADIILTKPEAGNSQTAQTAPDGNYVFDFSASDASLSRNGDNLSINFQDGASIQLEGFYASHNEENPPTFNIEGQEFTAQDFFTAMNEPDLMPAAGPGTGTTTAAANNRYHEYANMDLANGIDHLNRLDWNMSRGFEPEENLNSVGRNGDDYGWVGGTEGVDAVSAPVQPGTGHQPSTPVNHPVTIVPSRPVYGSPEDVPDLPPRNPDDPNRPTPNWPTPPNLSADAPRSVVKVYEKNLGDDPNNPRPSAISESFIINAPDGVAKIEVGGKVIWTQAGLVPEADRTFTTDEGRLVITGFNPQTGKLTYEFVLERATSEHGKPGADEISHSIGVKVTDTDGDTAQSAITVIIQDDIPEATADAATITEGQILSGNVITGTMAVDHQVNVAAKLEGGKDNYGADGQGAFNGAELVRWDVPENAVQNEDGSYTVVTDNATITLNPDGSYRVVSASASTEPIRFNYSIVDADDDMASSSLTIAIEPTRPVISENPKDPDPDPKPMPDPEPEEEPDPDPNDPTPDPDDPSKPMATVGKIVMDEGNNPQHGNGGNHLAGTDVIGTGSFLVNINGEPSGSILIGTKTNGSEITLKDGRATIVDHGSIVVNGIYVYVTGATYDPASQNWVVTYKYKLTGAQDHRLDGNDLASLSPNGIPITATDESGDVAYGKLTVELHDDVPSISVVGDAPNKVEFNFGADSRIGEESVRALEVLDKDGKLLKWHKADDPSETTNLDKATEGDVFISGSIQVEVAGNGQLIFSYVDSAAANSRDNLTVRVTDADGDTKDAQVKLAMPSIIPDPDPDNPDPDPDKPDPKPDPNGNPIKPGAEISHVTVDESQLDDGSKVQGVKVVNNSFAINTHNEGGEITFSFGEGENAKNFTISLDENDTATDVPQSFITNQGTFTVNSIQKGVVSYTYELTSPETVENDDRGTHQDAEKINVTLVDNINNDTTNGVINVNIVDDVPTLSLNGSDANLTIIAGEDGTGKIDWSYGADNASENTLRDFSVSINGEKEVNITDLGEMTLEGASTKLIIDAEGNFTTEAIGKGSDTPDVYTFTIVDADGDTVTKTITVSNAPVHVKPYDPNVTGNIIEVYEENMPDGSGEPNVDLYTGNGSFTAEIPASQDGTITLSFDNQQVTLNVPAEGTRIDQPKNATITVDGVDVTILGAELVDGVWQVNYEYELTVNQEHGKPGSPTDQVLSGNSIKIVVASGEQSKESSLDVKVHDDIPHVEKVVNDTTVSVTMGADAGDDSTVNAIIAGADGKPVTLSFNDGKTDLQAMTEGDVWISDDNQVTVTRTNEGWQFAAATDVKEPINISVVATDTDDDQAYTQVVLNSDDTPPPPFIPQTPELSLKPSDMYVREEDLGKDGTSDSGALKITATDGLETVTIGGVPVVKEGKLLDGVTIDAPDGVDGKLVIDSFDPATGVLNYHFVLDKATQNHEHGGDTDINLDFNYTVKVTDSNGSTGDATIKVVIKDDVPESAPDKNTLTEGKSAEATGNLLTGARSDDLNDFSGKDNPGADGWKQGSIELTDADGNVLTGSEVTDAEGNVIGHKYVGEYGELTINKNDGSYTYTLREDYMDEDGNARLPENLEKEVFYYQVEDQDGDVSSSTLTIDLIDTPPQSTGKGLELILKDVDAFGENVATNEKTSALTDLFKSDYTLEKIEFGNTDKINVSGVAKNNFDWEVKDNVLTGVNEDGVKVTVTLDYIAADGTVKMTASLADPAIHAKGSDSINITGIQLKATDETQSTAINSAVSIKIEDAPIDVQIDKIASEATLTSFDGNGYNTHITFNTNSVGASEEVFYNSDLKQGLTAAPKIPFTNAHYWYAGSGGTTAQTYTATTMDGTIEITPTFVHYKYLIGEGEKYQFVQVDNVVDITNAIPRSAKALYIGKDGLTVGAYTDTEGSIYKGKTTAWNGTTPGEISAGGTGQKDGWHELLNENGSGGVVNFESAYGTGHYLGNNIKGIDPDNVSEAVMFDTHNGLISYGFNIKLGLGTGDRVLLTFMLTPANSSDDTIVKMVEINLADLEGLTPDENGVYTIKPGLTRDENEIYQVKVPDGFTKVLVSALPSQKYEVGDDGFSAKMDNSSGEKESSGFTIKEVDFLTATYTSTGKVTATSVEFDQFNWNFENLLKDGKVVFVKGEDGGEYAVRQDEQPTTDDNTTTYTFRLSDGKLDGQILFQATINHKDGTWEVVHFREFEMLNQDDAAFQIVATDVDGDEATIDVNITAQFVRFDNVEQGYYNPDWGATDIVTKDTVADILVGNDNKTLMYGKGGADLLIGDTYILGEADNSEEDDSGNTDVDKLVNAIITATKDINQQRDPNNECYSKKGNMLVDKLYEKISELDDEDKVTLGEKLEGHEQKTHGRDALYGGRGNDILFGAGGDDYLSGDIGKDIIYGGSGNDIILYDKDDLYIDGGSGNNIIVSGNMEFSLADLLGRTKSDKNGPVVRNVQMLLKSASEFTSTLEINSHQNLANYGITITDDGVNLSADWEWVNKEDDSKILVFEKKIQGNKLTLEVDASVYKPASTYSMTRAASIAAEVGMLTVLATANDLEAAPGRQEESGGESRETATGDSGLDTAVVSYVDNENTQTDAALDSQPQDDFDNLIADLGEVNPTMPEGVANWNDASYVVSERQAEAGMEKESTEREPAQPEDNSGLADNSSENEDSRIIGTNDSETLPGTSGDDFIDGLGGKDTIYAGAGNDIIVYDPTDYLVDGGSGIDFLLGEKDSLSLKEMMNNYENNDSENGPMVHDVEIMITGGSLTDIKNLDDLAAKYNLDISRNDRGEIDKVALGEGWNRKDGEDGDSTHTFTNGDITLETTLAETDPASQEIILVAQQQIQHEGGI